MPYIITIARTNVSPDPQDPVRHTEVFKQEVDDLDVNNFIRQLNTKPRRRRNAKAKPADE